jgi:hypothetical protein
MPMRIVTKNLDPFESHPGDPVQGFDEVSEPQLMPLEASVQSAEDAEAAQDLAEREAEVDEIAEQSAGESASAGTGGATDEVSVPEPVRDAGDLYGVHTPPAVDRDHPDDDQAYAEGQNWIEALQTSAIENGAEPERALDDIVDDQDVLRPPHASDTRDTPVADRGSGGPGGL